MISQQMKDALIQCIVARAMYKGNPTQENLSTWDDRWVDLMAVNYASPNISDLAWRGLCAREDDLMLDQMALVSAIQRDQRAASAVKN